MTTTSSNILNWKKIIYFEGQKRQRKYFFSKIKQMAKKNEKKGRFFFQISGLIIICKLSCEDDGFMNMLSSSGRFSSYSSLSSTISRKISNFEIEIYRMFILSKTRKLITIWLNRCYQKTYSTTWYVSILRPTV